jgi:hypothetical protein
MRQKNLSRWQNTIGKIVAEPTGILHPGACELPLDTEVIFQVDNLLENGKPTGKYVTFYRVNVHDNKGSVVHSNQKLADGKNYNPIGKITVEPIIPAVTGYLRRLTNNESWESSDRTQSASFAIEYANSKNIVEVLTPDSQKPILLNKLNYNMKWAVDGDRDPNLQGIKITATGSARVLVNWTQQPELIEISPSNAPIDPLELKIDVPPALEENESQISFKKAEANESNKSDKEEGIKAAKNSQSRERE